MQLNTTTHIAKHLREFYFGKNWTWVNLKETISDVTYAEAIQKVSSLNSILALVFHIHYYLEKTMDFFGTGELNALDKYSFDHPQITSEEEWAAYKEKLYTEAEAFALLVEKMPDSKLWTIMAEEKYGNYYRNLQGIIEHGHYHLGQIVILKKLIRKE